MVFAKTPFCKSDVLASRGVVFELLLKMVFGGLCLGENQETRGVAVQPVNDEDLLRRPLVLHVVEQRSVERLRSFLCRGHSQETGGLLHDEEFVILEQ